MAALDAVKQEKIAGFVDSGYNRKNQERIKRDEEELAAMMGQNSEEQQEEPQQQEEPKVDDKPLGKEEESFKKRYGDLRRHMAEKEKEWEAKFEALKNQDTSTAIIPPKSDEDLEAWISKYPDVAGIVDALVKKRLKDVDERVQDLDKLRWESKRLDAEAQIKKAHPDFEELKEADEFHDWLDEQPKWVQDAMYENLEDSKAAIRVLDLYKADKGLTAKARKQAEKEAAGFVKANSKSNVDEDKGGYVYSESQVHKMSSQEYEKHEDKILEAMRSGKFLYDMSGGAR